MNLLLADESEVIDGCIVVTSRRAKHVCEVLRLQPGDSVRVGVRCKWVGTGIIARVSAEEVVVESLHLAPIKTPKVRLIVALPRPKALRNVLHTAASFGVAHIDVVNAWRVDKSYWQSPRLTQEALEQDVWLGCEQGQRAWIPTVSTHRFLVPYLEALKAAPMEQEQRILAHPAGPTWLSDLPNDCGWTRVFAVGPEGGWIQEELDSFQKAGFVPCRLSLSTLRSEIAVAAFLAQVELLSQQLMSQAGCAGAQE